MPPQWSKLLTSSAITKEEAARHPEAVLDVLQFYTQQQLGASAGDYQPAPIPTMPPISRTNSSAATRFEGVGLAGQQQRQRDRERERERESEKERETSQPRPPPAAVRTPSTQVSHDFVGGSDNQPAAVKPRQLLAERKAPPPPRPPAAQTMPEPAAISRPPETKPEPVPAQPAPTAREPTARVERRISTMNEAQIMEKLRSVVSPDDPSQLYSKIKKVGQG